MWPWLLNRTAIQVTVWSEMSAVRSAEVAPLLGVLSLNKLPNPTAIEQLPAMLEVGGGPELVQLYEQRKQGERAARLASAACARSKRFSQPCLGSEPISHVLFLPTPALPHAGPTAVRGDLPYGYQNFGSCACPMHMPVASCRHHAWDACQCTKLAAQVGELHSTRARRAAYVLL